MRLLSLLSILAVLAGLSALFGPEDKKPADTGKKPADTGATGNFPVVVPSYRGPQKPDWQPARSWSNRNSGSVWDTLQGLQKPPASRDNDPHLPGYRRVEIYVPPKGTPSLTGARPVVRW